LNNRKSKIGGIVHQYQKYDPKNFPSPTLPPPDMVSPAFEHLLAFGSMRRLSEEELARAVKIDPSQFKNLGPSIDMLMAMLLERKRKILAKYETESVVEEAHQTFRKEIGNVAPPRELKQRYRDAAQEQQIYDLERLWYAHNCDTSPFAQHLLRLMDRLGDQYQIDELAAKYEFTGRDSLSIPQAIAIKEELEKIDELLKQLEEARQTAQIAVIDLDALSEFSEPGDVEQLRDIQRLVEEYTREMAKQQGLEHSQGRFQLTPKAYRMFQGTLLRQIFSDLQAARSGRHQGEIVGDGAVEMTKTKPYEFGDSITQMDIPQSFTNALLRSGGEFPVRLKPEDIEVHQTRNNPKAATAVIMDMSGSMRYDGQYINVKRMALALDGLIRCEYPGDYLQFIEMYSFAKARTSGEIVEMLPKPVTIHDPWVQLAYDMSREDISEHMIHPHFTNIQHALRLSRQHLMTQDTPNKQIILITDGLPTAHFQDQHLCLLYPPNPLTEQATMEEGMRCQREGITINIFLIPSWSQTEEDIRFAYRLAETTTGRVFFTAGKELDRFVVWDYIKRKRQVLG
jgi:uncharacterized protein with von Willebrand factor type A (vWA) domain